VPDAGDITMATRDDTAEPIEETTHVSESASAFPAHKEQSKKTGCRGGGGGQEKKKECEQETTRGRCGGGGSSSRVSPLDGDGHDRTAGAGAVAAPSDSRGALHTRRPDTDVVALAIGTTPFIDIPTWATAGDETWVLRRKTGPGQNYMRFNGRSHIDVGRSSEADEQLAATSCSRIHAVLVFSRLGDQLTNTGDGEGGGGVIRVSDLQSKHGTYVRVTRVTNGERTDILEGDAVTFGAENTDVDAGVTYKLFREPIAGKSTTASGDAPNPSASGNDGLLRPVIRRRNAGKETSTGDERTGGGTGQIPAKKGTGNSDLRPEPDEHTQKRHRQETADVTGRT
jgi:hypothetical protein